jgi:hypothetical protein
MLIIDALQYSSRAYNPIVENTIKQLRQVCGLDQGLWDIFHERSCDGNKAFPVQNKKE